MKEKLIQLQRALQLLAADYQTQINAYPPFVAFGDELVNDFDEAYTQSIDILKKEALINEKQIEKLANLDSFIDSKSGLHNKDFWLEKEELQQNPDWQKIRKLAADCLKAFEKE